MYNIKEDLETIKDSLTNMYIAFNNIKNENAIKNRESNIPETVLKQLSIDKVFLYTLRNDALKVFDKCNKLIMIDTNSI